MPDAAGCLLPGCASGLWPCCGLMFELEGGKLTGTAIIEWLGAGGKSMGKAELQSWETNVSKGRQRAGDGEWAGGRVLGRNCGFLVF